MDAILTTSPTFGPKGRAKKSRSTRYFFWTLVNCPACGKSVSRNAPSCIGCGEPLKTPEEILASGHAKAIKPDETIGILLLVLPTVSALLIVFWIGSMNLLQNPGSTLAFIVIATVIACGLLVGFEANQLGVGSDTDIDDKGSKKTGPVGWAVFTMLMWVIGYPAYMGHRSKYGANDLLFGAILTTFLFISAIFYINYAIEEKKAQVRAGVREVQKELDDLERSFRYNSNR
ncbi:MAG: hypothetical protein ACKO2G_01790 [Verrucomicrobiales bacterium]